MYTLGIISVILFPLWSEVTAYVALGFGTMLIIPTAIDGTTQLFGARESTNPLRLTTGSLLGVGVPVFVWGVVLLIL
jgi:uncharacterized membrane protein